MLLSCFKSAWRNLAHYKGYTIINIAGLATAISACVLIGLFVDNEMSFDKQVPDRENVFRLDEYLHYNGATPQLGAATGVPLAPLLKADHGEVEDYVRIFPATPYIYPSISLEYRGKKVHAGRMLCTDSSFGRMFGIHPTEGSQQHFMPLRNSIVLTQSLARGLFGDEPALNRMVTFRVDDTTAYQMAVSNVIPDFPPTSHISGEGLVPIPESYIKGYFGDNYGILLGPTYLRLRPGADIAALEKEFTKTIHKKNTGIDMRLQKMADVHAGSMSINYDSLNAGKIDGKYLKVFIIIALAIFAIACSNFVNLTISIAAYRGKEVAVKKILGAGRAQIMTQVFVEAFLSVLIAMLFSIFLAYLCLPFLNAIVGRQLPVSSMFGGTALVLYAGIVVLTSLLAGAYPAFLIAASRVEQALRTRLLFGESRTSLRNILVTGQFAIAVLFIISLMVFLRQLDYMRKKDLGYSYAQVVKVPLNIPAANRLETLRAELSKIPGVQDITYGYMELGGSGGTFGVDYAGPDGAIKHISADMENGDANYVRFFHMKIVAGRDFTQDHPQNEYLINESMARLIGHADPVGKEINIAGGFPKGTIVGVVKDFNYGSIHNKIAPLLIASINYIAVWKSQLYIKVAADGVSGTLSRVGSTLRPFFNGSDEDLQFLDEHFNQVYSAEKEASTLIAIIGGLAVSIACLGLLSLSAFVIARRTREIGIRKVLGASVSGIVAILSNEFIRLVVIGFLIAAPIAGWMMNSWLQGFAYRVDLGWWIFPLAGALAVGVAVLTISFISIRAARANPVNSLRSE